MADATFITPSLIISAIPNEISACSGLVGVAIGALLSAWLTDRREIRRGRERITKEANDLAILIGAHLNRFIDGCMQVVLDDGTRGLAALERT